MQDFLIFKIKSTSFQIDSYPVHQLQINNKDLYRDPKQVHICSLYFTKPYLKQIQSHLNQPQIYDIPNLDQFNSCFCFEKKKEEDKVKIMDSFFTDLRNNYSIKGRLHKFLQTMNLKINHKPLKLFEDVRDNMKNKYFSVIKLITLNPLNEPPKKFHIKIAGAKLHELGILEEGGNALVYRYAFYGDDEPVYCLKKYENPFFSPKIPLELRKSESGFKERTLKIQQYLSDYSVLVNKLSHINIVEYSQAVLIRDKNTDEIKDFCILMKYCNKGNLKNFLKEKQNIKDEDIKGYFKQILQALKYLRKQNPPIKHGDIKPENVLVHEQDGKIILKLCDFGTCQKIYEKGTPFYRDPLRTLPYCAPQLLKHSILQLKVVNKNEKKGTFEILGTEKMYSDKCDIWSLGILLYEMLFGVNPWSDIFNQYSHPDFIIQALENKFFGKNKLKIIFPRKIDKILSYAIEKMLKVDENDRIEFEVQKIFLKKPQEQIQLENKGLFELFDLNGEENIELKLKTDSSHNYNERSLLSLTDRFSAEVLHRQEHCPVTNIYVRNFFDPNSSIISENNSQKSLNSRLEEEENKMNGGEFNEIKLELPINSAILFDIEWTKRIKKCKNFQEFNENLINKLNLYWSQETRLLRFFLKKLQYALYYLELKNLLDQNVEDFKVRNIKGELQILLNKNKINEIPEDIFQEIPENIRLETISDYLPEDNEKFVEILSKSFLKIMLEIKKKVLEDINPNQTEEQLREKIYVYQDLTLILNSESFYNIGEEYQNPFNLKQLNNKRKLMDLMELKNKLQLI